MKSFWISVTKMVYGKRDRKGFKARSQFVHPSAFNKKFPLLTVTAATHFTQHRGGASRTATILFHFTSTKVHGYKLR